MTNPLRLALLAAAIALAGCAAPTPVPLYTLPADHPNSAEVEFLLSQAGRERNYGEGLALRGAAKCNPSTLFSFGIKVVEEPARPIARTRVWYERHASHLPAGEPLALQFWQNWSNGTSYWNTVVLLAPGARYRAFINDRTPSIVDKDTGLEALRLPHDYFQRQLNCP